MAIKAREFVRDYGLFTCIQCGKCTGGCPLSRKTILNIRGLIYELLLADNNFDPDSVDVLWDCTTCSTCSERCPKDVKPMDIIIGLRSVVVEGGRVPKTAKVALNSVFTKGNTLSMAREDRDLWTEGLSVQRLSEDPEVDYLFYVGCSPSYDPRVQKVSQAMVKVFEKAGVAYGILGQEEVCCGSEVRRLGEQGLFEMQVEDNMLLWQDYDVKKVVTASPHCYNTFKNDYAAVAVELAKDEELELELRAEDVQFMHYTQLVAQLIKDGKLAFEGELDKTVTYHDPCYLGKQNHIFDEPRFILESIPGLKLVEMDRCRERSLCCEGGGGRMWLEGTNIEERLAHQRVQEALATGAEILATACPFCLLTLEDAVKSLGLEEQLQVLDIMELLAQVV
jgi:Fe-S oxidoreductase